jgi:alkylation response protein AidB-like acyl-CoA dehydrogenase
MQEFLDDALTGEEHAYLGTATRYGEVRQTFGKKLTAHQGLAWSLADVSTDLEALRALTRRAGLRVEYGLGRHFAAAKIAAYTDGSTEIMQDRIVAGMLKFYGGEN